MDITIPVRSPYLDVGLTLEQGAFDPRKPVEERDLLIREVKKVRDAALESLASIPITTTTTGDARPISLADNGFCDLASYICHVASSTIRGSMGCCVRKPSTEERFIPIPKESFEALALTTKAFNRNVGGLLSISALLVCIPFLPVEASVALGLSVAANEATLYVAGWRTYVRSGDIGVMRNGRGGWLVQSGFRVNAKTSIVTAYELLASRLKERRLTLIDTQAPQHERSDLYSLCVRIRGRWATLEQTIANFGIPSDYVGEILKPLGHEICVVLDSFAPVGASDISLLVDSTLQEMGTPQPLLVVTSD